MKTKNNYKQEMIEILIEINRLLTEHLKVQKSIFNPPVSAKIRIPFIYKRIVFESLYETNKEIQGELYQTIRKIANEKDKFNIDPLLYGGIKDYALLFHSSSEKLSQIAYELHLKEIKENKLTDEEYNQLVSEYQRCENTRLNKGNTIQIIAGLLAE